MPTVQQRQNNAYAKHVAHIRDAHARRRAALQKLADAVNGNKYYNAVNNRAYDDEGFTYYNVGSNSNENLVRKRRH
jgi:hypothetical protein